MKNRYGDEYYFEEVEPKIYRFHMETSKSGFGMRMGGKEGQEKIDMNDLGMFDPSGGPFVCVGGKIYWDEIHDGKKGGAPKIVKRIMRREDGIFVEVE